MIKLSSCIGSLSSWQKKQQEQEERGGEEKVKPLTSAQESACLHSQTHELLSEVERLISWESITLKSCQEIESMAKKETAQDRSTRVREIDKKRGQREIFRVLCFCQPSPLSSLCCVDSSPMSAKVVIYSSASGGTITNKTTIAMDTLVRSVGCGHVLVVYLDVSPEDKQMVWGKSGMKGKYPLLFVNDEFVGDYQTVVDMNEDGLLRPKLGL